MPFSFVERFYQTYVHPSVTFGLELIPAGPQIARFQQRILQWGRRLLGWPRGSPSLVVQGKLAWPDANTVRLSRAAGLWFRLPSLPRGCLAGHLAHLASQQPLAFSMGYIHCKRIWGCRCAASCGLGKSFWMCTKFGWDMPAKCYWAGFVQTTFTVCNKLRKACIRT